MTKIRAAVLLAVFGMFPLIAVAEAKDFQIETQALSQALVKFSEQSQLVVTASSNLLAGKSAPSVSGQMEPEEALGKLLAGSGLKFVKGEGGDLTVVPADRAATLGKPTASRSEDATLRIAQASTSSAVTETPQPAEDSTVRLEEIIVTAQKKEERLKDVPLSIAVVTAEDIDRRRLINSEDYLRGIPGVNQASENYGQSIVIRGIESSPSFQNAASGTTVATYFGETPTTNSAGLAGYTNIDLKLVDVERVEVLRGPQGTAFGNSSLGGAVRTIPVAPRNDFEGKVSVGFSDTGGTGSDNLGFQAVFNAPLVADRVAVRLVGYRFKDSGFYRNRAASDAAFQAAVAPFGVDDFLSDANHIGEQEVTGGRIAASFQATDRLSFTLGYLKQKTEVDGFALANSGTYAQSILEVAPEHVRRGQQFGVADSDIDLTNATAKYDLGWGDLLATYSHISSESLWVRSVTGELLLPISGLGEGPHRENTGEIRLSTRLDGAWQFLAGVYAEDLHDDRTVEYRWMGAGPALLGTSVDGRKLTQKAAFSEVSWKFLPQWTLTGGVRAYDYERTNRIDSDGLFGNQAATLKTDASGTSFRGNLSYKPTEDSLVYASWSQGFRLGTPQTGLPPGLCDQDNDGIVDGTTGLSIADTRRVESDKVKNYELGARFSALDRRLSVAADVFRIDWTGLPVLTLAPLPTQGGCGQSYNANAGAARSQGVELEMNLQVAKGLRVDAGASWIKAELTRDAPLLSPPASDGDRLPGAPKINANLALQYEFSIAGREAFVRTDSIYVGTFYGDPAQTPNTESGGYVKLDASARVTFGHLNVDLFARNLTDEDDFTFRGVADYGQFYGYRLRPRTFGLQVGYEF